MLKMPVCLFVLCTQYIFFNLALSCPSIHLQLSISFFLKITRRKSLLFFSVILFFFFAFFSFVRGRVHARALVISLSIAFKLYSCTYIVAVVAFFYVFECVCLFVNLSLASGDLLLKQLSFGIFIVVNA